MHIMTRLLGDGPRWSSMYGLQGAVLEFSAWPEGEDWEITKEWLLLIMGTLERHAQRAAKSRFTGFDDIEIAADTLRQPESQ